MPGFSSPAQVPMWFSSYTEASLGLVYAASASECGDHIINCLDMSNLQNKKDSVNNCVRELK